MFMPHFDVDDVKISTVDVQLTPLTFQPLTVHGRIAPWIRLREDGTWDFGSAWKDVHPWRGSCDVALDGTCSECARVVASMCDFPSFAMLPRDVAGCYPQTP
jgi:hypothetical protein